MSLSEMFFWLALACLDVLLYFAHETLGLKLRYLALLTACLFGLGLAMKDVEYARNIICGQYGVNLVAFRVAETAKDSYDNSPSLFSRTFSDLRPVVVDGEETGAFTIELPRLKRVIKAIAYAMYFHDFGQRNEGDFDMFSTSLYHDMPDGYESLRHRLDACAFKSMPVPQPKVFKYGIVTSG